MEPAQSGNILMYVVFLPFVIGIVASFILQFGTTKYERMHSDSVSDPKKRKRIKLGNWACWIGIGLTVVLFLILRAAGQIH